MSVPAYQLDQEAAIAEIRRLGAENARLNRTLIDMYERIIPEEIEKGIKARLVSDSGAAD